MEKLYSSEEASMDSLVGFSPMDISMCLDDFFLWSQTLAWNAFAD